MPITRLNHAVLYVRDAQRSADFYTEVLGFRRLPLAEGMAGAAFLQAPGSTNDHDLGLFSVGEAARAVGRGVGLYHLAWEVDTLAELERLSGVLSERRALVGASDHGTTKSLYGRDVDGIEFEIAWIVPAHLLDQAATEGQKSIQPLDLAREQRRYGADTRGGVGISTPASAI
ncbi:MAG: VOC family protein [Actinomycetota bacterium]|nr:VOC family protein [Actinomycetota bacterium]